MTPAQLKVIAVLVAAVALVMIGALAAWFWQANSYGKQISDLQAGFQADLAKISTVAAQQANKALEKQQAAEIRLAALDKEATEDRTRALLENEKLSRQYLSSVYENDRLRGDVADGARRLRIAGRCSASGSNLLPAAGAARLDDAASVELTGEAGQAVFDIREGIIKDRQALTGLQRYVREFCPKQ